MNEGTDSFTRFYCMASVLELELSKNDVYAPKLSYLDVLYLNLIYIGDKVTVSSISDKVGVSRAAVTTKVKSLESRGLVVKRPNESDGRSYYLGLSENMERAYSVEWRIFESVYDELIGRYGQERMESFREILDSATTLISERGHSTK